MWKYPASPLCARNHAHLDDEGINMTLRSAGIVRRASSKSCMIGRYWAVSCCLMLKGSSFCMDSKDIVVRGGTGLEDAIKMQLGLTSKKEWPQYSCVFVIPDFYDKSYVSQILEMLMREFAFARVCFILPE